VRKGRGVRPLISVIIPFFNPGSLLRQAVQSVLANGYHPVEIILVDDGSTESVQLLAEHQSALRLIRQPNRGPAAARNRGWREAHGELVAFLDADDLWSSGSLSSLYEALIQKTGADIAQGQIERLLLDGPQNPRRSSSLRPYYGVNLGSCLFRRSCLERLNGFDESLRHGEDSNFFVDAWQRGISKARISSVVLCYRLHASNMTLEAPADEGAVGAVWKRV
jgi:glycosyltransferase involved in cell wall biosynthesis